MKFLKNYFLFFILFFLTNISFAQPPICDPGLCVSSDGLTCVPCDVPIDGGASLLLIAGGAYGIKKIRNYRKSKKTENE